MTFGEKLVKCRKQNALSQEQLAEKLNVSRQAVSRWESGVFPDMENVVKIGRFFDCSLEFPYPRWALISAVLIIAGVGTLVFLVKRR